MYNTAVLTHVCFVSRGTQSAAGIGEGLNTLLTLTQDNTDQYLEEDLEGQVRHKIDHCCEILFYRFVAPLSFTEWPLLQRYSECSTDIAVK